MSATAQKKSKGRHFLYSLIACVVIVVGGSVLAMAASSLRVSTATNGDDAPERLPNVNVMVLDAMTVYDALRLTGGIEPWHDVTLSAEIGGRVVEQPVQEGQRVAAGDLIARIDTDLLRAQTEEIEARLALAREELSRLNRLRERGAGTAQDADRAATEVRVLEANLRTARINIDRSVVRAPVEGIVDTLFQEQSEYIDPGMPLARIVQVDRVKVVVGLPERDVPFFELGDTVQTMLDALPGREFQGTIYRISTTGSAGTRTFKTEIELPNEDGAIRPGMIARVRLVRQEFPNSMLIPMNAVLSLEDRHAVFVEEDGIAQLREVTVGLVQGSEVQIVSGLQDGEHLIVTGQRDVRPGRGVMVRDIIGDREPTLPTQPGELPL